MILVALCMIVILAFAAISIDVSQLFAYRNMLQRSADAAALAGAIELTKATYGNAAPVATAYANTNSIEGQNPTVDAIEYGTWDPAARTFISACVAPGCTDPTMAAANALRVTLSGGPTAPIFAQFLGQATSPTSITVNAISWTAPTAPEHDCIKPLTLRYSTLIAVLDTAEGLPGNFPLDSLRELTQLDLDTLRSEGRNLMSECFTLATDPAGPCIAGSGPATAPGAVYTPAQIYPPGAGSLPAQLQAPCAGTDTIGRGDPIDTASIVNGFNFDPGNAYTAADQWCTLYGNPPWTAGPTPCLMKLALWQNAAVTGTATDGTGCSVAAPCPVVKAIVPYIITSVNPGNAAIQGYPTLAVDEAAIGNGFPTTAFSRVVLVQ
jgi:Flp pilus assembly protein TadG